MRQFFDCAKAFKLTGVGTPFRTTVMLTMAIFMHTSVEATHNRSGHISYRYISGLTYEVTVTTYTVPDSPADRPWFFIAYGDGSIDTIYRLNGGGNGEILSPWLKKNSYIGMHTYPTTGYYAICMEDPNRNGGILNVPNSINVPFSIAAELDINAFIGPNSSATIAAPPLHLATANRPVRQNVAAYDPDGDELRYELVDCMGEFCGQIEGYTTPEGVSVNPINGDFLWENPQVIGEYNFAIKISECRGGTVIASSIIDFQVAVLPSGNMPALGVPDSWQTEDPNTYVLHVEPGTEITFDMVVTDVEDPEILLHSEPDAIATMLFATDSSDTGYLRKTFSWTPQSARCTPYLTVFRGSSGTALNPATDLALLIYVHEAEMECAPQCPSTSVGSDPEENSQILIFPNPTDGEVRFMHAAFQDSDMMTVELIGIDGRVVALPLQAREKELKADVNGLSSGLYMYRLWKNGRLLNTGRIAVY